MGLVLSFLNQRITNWLNHEKEPHAAPMSNFERIRYELRPCDVILVEGRSRVSNVIRMVTQSPWTHAALYIGRLHDIEDPKFRARLKDHFGGDPDVQLIIESQLGSGTTVRPLNYYQQYHLRICRPKGLSYQDSQQAVNFAISRLGLDYDIRQILDLARFLFPWTILPRRWRSSLFAHNAGRPTRTVCSTMIAEAFAYIQFPILPLVHSTRDNEVRLYRRNPRICTPKDFDYSPYFEIIKYPFIDCSDYGNYRLLPWHGSGALLDENNMTLAPRQPENRSAAGAAKTTQAYSIGKDTFLVEDDELHNLRQQDPLIEEITRANGDNGVPEDNPQEAMPNKRK